MISDQLARSGIPVLDLLLPMRAVNGERLYKLQDTHWNIRGNQVAAGIIAAELHNRALLAAGKQGLGKN